MPLPMQADAVAYRQWLNDQKVAEREAARHLAWQQEAAQSGLTGPEQPPPAGWQPSTEAIEPSLSPIDFLSLGPGSAVASGGGKLVNAALRGLSRKSAERLVPTVSRQAGRGVGGEVAPRLEAGLQRSLSETIPFRQEAARRGAANLAAGRLRHDIPGRSLGASSAEDMARMEARASSDEAMRGMMERPGGAAPPHWQRDWDEMALKTAPWKRGPQPRHGFEDAESLGGKEMREVYARTGDPAAALRQGMAPASELEASASGKEALRGMLERPGGAAHYDPYGNLGAPRTTWKTEPGKSGQVIDTFESPADFAARGGFVPELSESTADAVMRGVYKQTGEPAKALRAGMSPGFSGDAARSEAARTPPVESALGRLFKPAYEGPQTAWQRHQAALAEDAVTRQAANKSTIESIENMLGQPLQKRIPISEKSFQLPGQASPRVGVKMEHPLSGKAMQSIPRSRNVPGSVAPEPYSRGSFMIDRSGPPRMPKYPNDPKHRSVYAPEGAGPHYGHGPAEKSNRWHPGPPSEQQVLRYGDAYRLQPTAAELSADQLKMTRSIQDAYDQGRISREQLERYFKDTFGKVF